MTRLGALVACSAIVVACGSRSGSSDETTPAKRPALVSRSDAGAPTETAPKPPDFPKTASLDAFGEGERIADLAAIGFADRMLLAWVTYVDPGLVLPRKAGGARRAGPAAPASPARKDGASVMVRSLDSGAEALTEPKLIAGKADSVGGVALARGPGSQGEVGLVWVGKEGGLGQVFMARLSSSGDKQVQKQLTRSKGSCSDVALMQAGEGWIAGWLESREGSVEVYAAKVSRDLRLVGTPRRVAQTKGEASELRLLARPEDIVVAWAEVRRETMTSGVFLARLSSGELAIRGDPAPVVLSPGQARAPELARVEDGVVLGWVQDASGGGKERSAQTRTVWLTRLDAAARSSGEPLRVPLAADASSVALDCERACRIVVPGAEKGELVLYGFPFDGARGAGAPARLATIGGVSTEDTSPLLVGDWLFFAEDNLHGGGRIRKAKIAWH